MPSDPPGLTVPCSALAVSVGRQIAIVENPPTITLVAVADSFSVTGAQAAMPPPTYFTADPQAWSVTGVDATFVLGGGEVFTGQRAKPDADVSAGGWTPSTGTDLFAMVNSDSASDTTWIESTATPVADTAVLELSEIQLPGPGAVVIKVRARKAP